MGNKPNKQYQPPGHQPPIKPPVQPPQPLAPPDTDLHISRDLALLHPVVRNAAVEVLRECQNEQLPFQLFEAFRTPVRQAYLYEQGRGKPGAIITHAKPWESYHNYGLAVDLVLYLDGKWDWDAIGTLSHCWIRLTEIGHLYGLEGLSFEKPHLQLAGIELHQLRAGTYPGGGDQSWWDNLEKCRNRVVDRGIST